MSYLLPLINQERISVSALEKIFAAHGRRPDFIPEVFRLFDLLDPETTWRALWLLLTSVRAHGLADDDIKRLAVHIDSPPEHWLSRLTFCQLLASAGCPPSVRDEFFPLLCDCFSDRRVIVRAWALTALTHFQEPKFRKPVATMFRAAQKDPGKAMQARLRQLAAASSPRTTRE